MRRFIFMLSLVLAGELIFSLPYHTTRFFRPTFLQVFELSNTQLGDMFAVYGITAMLAYFPGGVIADHYSPRSLMTFSLFATAAGGLYMATIPGQVQLTLLYGFWGISTILLFWSAMISATRQWGGRRSQGKAFGILDGGRGLVAAAVAVLAVAALSLYMPDDMSQVSGSQRLQGFRAVILLYTAATASAGVLIWLVLPRSVDTTQAVINPVAGMLAVMRRPIVWAQALIIVCAYCGFKGSDNYSLYAVQVLGMDEVAAAKFTAYASYLRPVGAVAAGIVADRFAASKVITVTFIVLILCYVLLTIAAPSAAWTNIIFANLLISYFVSLRASWNLFCPARRVPNPPPPDRIYRGFYLAGRLHTGYILCPHRWQAAGQWDSSHWSPTLFHVSDSPGDTWLCGRELLNMAKTQKSESNQETAWV